MSVSNTRKTKGNNQYVTVNLDSYHERQPITTMKPYSVRTVEEFDKIRYQHKHDVDYAPKVIEVPSSLLTEKQKRNDVHSEYALNVALIELDIERKRYVSAISRVEGLVTDILVLYDDDGNQLVGPDSKAAKDVTKVQEKYREQIRSEIRAKTKECAEIMELTENASDHVLFLLENLLFGGNLLFIKTKSPENSTRFVELALSIIAKDFILGIFEPPYPETIDELELLPRLEILPYESIALFSDFEKLKMNKNLWKIDDKSPFSAFRKNASRGNIKFIFVGNRPFKDRNSRYNVLRL
ncbi:MAG: hypothetical protein ACFFES_14340 [Candidatus Thorarchaeota archaeon]